MMSAHDHLQQTLDDIVSRAGLTAPSGRPLYTYRLTSSEATALRTGLTTALAPGQPLRPVTGRAFCLWAADHYSRSYDGGAQMWLHVLGPLGFSEDGITNAELKTLVEAGMRYWKRQVIRMSGKEMRLNTLIREGGLPIVLLRDDASRVSAYFKALFETVEQHSVAGVLTTPGETLAADLAYRFHLRRLADPDIAALSRDLVLAVRRLARAVPKGAAPVAALDAAEPQWRDDLPLRLDDETAQNFLERLLQDAVEVRQRAPRVIRWARVLRGEHRGAEGWRWQLAGRLDVPPQAPLDVVRRIPTAAALAPVDSLFDRFVLETRYEDGTSGDWARGRRQTNAENGTHTVHFDAVPRSRQRLDASQVIGRVDLVLRGLGRETEPTAEFPGGDPLSDDPWIFIDELADEVDLADLDAGASVEATLAAQASCREKHARAIVALPPSMQLRYEDRTTPLALGTLDGVTPPRTLYQVDRTAVAESAGGDSYRIRPAAPMGGAEHIEPVGRTSRLGAERVVVHLGVPRLRYTIGGDEQTIPKAQLQWWHRGPGEPASLEENPDPVGTGRLRWVRDGAVQHSMALTLLPGSFRWRLAAEDGTLTFDGLAGGEVEVLADEPSIQIAIERLSPMKTRVQVRNAPAQPPSALRVRFHWSGGSTGVLPFPFPAIVTRFGHRADGPVLEERTIAVHQLAQYLAVAVRPNGLMPKPLSGRLQLKIGAGTSASGSILEFEHPFPPLVDDTTSLPLNTLRDRITELFSSTLDRDALVRLTLPDDAGSSLLVRRYDLDAPPADAGGFCLAPGQWAGLSSRERDALSMRAYDLLHPTAPPLTLDRVERDHAQGPRWVAPGEAPLEGMWIAALFDGDLVRSRPRLLPGAEAAREGSPDALPPLVQALGVLRESTRRQAIADALAELARDPLAEGWNLALGLLERTTVLPPATFDLLTQIADDDAALASFLIRSAWESEEHATLAAEAVRALPCGVQGIHRATWISGITAAFAAFEREQILQLSVLRAQVTETRQRLLRMVPWIEPLWDRAGRAAGLAVPEDAAAKGADNPALEPILRARVAEAMKVNWPGVPIDLPVVHAVASAAKQFAAVEAFVATFPVRTAPPEYRSLLQAPIQMAALSVYGGEPIPAAARIQYRALADRYPDWVGDLHALAFWHASLSLTPQS